MFAGTPAILPTEDSAGLWINSSCRGQAKRST
jgi:hypothetical protein